MQEDGARLEDLGVVGELAEHRPDQAQVEVAAVVGADNLSGSCRRDQLDRVMLTGSWSRKRTDGASNFSTRPWSLSAVQRSPGFVLRGTARGT